MENLKQNWLKSFIIGIIVAITGSTGIGTIISSTMDVASGTPIQSVVKDLAVDSVKDTAIKTLYGDENDQESIGSMFNRNKYKHVSDKKSGPIGWIAPGWYVECYRIETDAFIGNRKYNKANGVNVKWNMANPTNFEIGNYKNNVAYSDSYVAYDSNTFKLVLGEVKKAKLNGYVVVYDEYYNTYELIEYKKGKETGYKLRNTDGKIYYSKDDEDIAVYNEEKKSFEKLKGLFNKKPSVNITKNADGYTYDFDKYSYSLYDNLDYVEYNSDKINFKGNAYSYTCEYNYKKDEAVTYRFETMRRLQVECTDGTIGEVLAVDDSDNSKEAITAKSISIALIKIGAHATVDTLMTGNLAVLDTAVELTTGESISDTLNVQLDNFIDDVFDEESELNENISNFNDKVNGVVDNITDFSDDRSLEEKIQDGLKGDDYDRWDDVQQEVGPDGKTTYTLPSGVSFTISED